MVEVGEYQPTVPELNEADEVEKEISTKNGNITMVESDSNPAKMQSPKLSSLLQRSQNQPSVVKPDVGLSKTPAMSTVPQGPRRSSSRSIKRPKFDDELVDASAFKRTSSRKTSESSPSEPKIRKVLSKQPSHTSVTSLQPKKKIKKIKPSPVPTDFGRWRPTDDLSLINAVLQVCDLQTVHLMVRFSCNFTQKEIQDRWFALLYDPMVSRLAQQSMKALPSDVINQIMKNALWSRDEDCILADINIENNPTMQDFQKVLEDNIDVFHRTRDAKHLYNHWLLLRHYHLLSCQSAKSISSNVQTKVAEMEMKINDDQIIGPEDDALKQEMSFTDRCHKREIRRLEKEISQWEILIEKSGLVEGLEVSDFHDETLAVLKGRILKYQINKKKVVVGRKSFDVDVNVDLSIEGPSLKISRNQGVITYEKNSFTLLNCGRRPFYVNGTPLATGSTTRLMNNSVIEIYCIKLLFNINPNLSSEDQKTDIEKSLPPTVVTAGSPKMSDVKIE